MVARQLKAHAPVEMEDPVFGRTKTVKDPVCGMRVDPETAAAHAGHAGRTYYFCSKNCADLFKAHPARYA